MPNLPKLGLLLVALTLIGCSSNRSSRPGGVQLSDIGWFCQMAEVPSEWDCVQDRQLAENPLPSRFPEPPQAPAERDDGEVVATADAAIAPLIVPPSFDSAAPAPAAAQPPGNDPATQARLEPTGPTGAPGQATPGDTTSATAAPTELPPPVDAGRGVALSDLPPDFYTVQLLAATDPEVLDEYLGHDGMTVVPIERDGELFYVLLLGAWPDQDTARRAATALPETMQHLTPWVRRLDSLQEAVSRAIKVAPQYDRNSAVPIYQQLAYQPQESVRLADLPGDFYTVQLLAVTSKELLEEYVQEEAIAGLSAARVERDGELFYVLLLGVYETEENAQLAARNLPARIQHLTPWVRELGSLQRAMARADQVAGSPQI